MHRVIETREKYLGYECFYDEACEEYYICENEIYECLQSKELDKSYYDEFASLEFIDFPSGITLDSSHPSDFQSLKDEENSDATNNESNVKVLRCLECGTVYARLEMSIEDEDEDVLMCYCVEELEEIENYLKCI